MKNDIKISVIKKYMIFKEITSEEFAKMCRVKKSEIKKILNGRKDFLYSTICNIAEILQVEVYDLIEKESVEIPKFYRL